MERGRSLTTYKEIKREEDRLTLNRYDKEGYIVIPPKFRCKFGRNVRILFDKERNLLALQPSDNEEDYHTTRWRVWCSNLFQEYNLQSQKVRACWQEKEKYLVGKVVREDGRS